MNPDKLRKRFGVFGVVTCMDCDDSPDARFDYYCSEYHRAMDYARIIVELCDALIAAGAPKSKKETP